MKKIIELFLVTFLFLFSIAQVKAVNPYTQNYNNITSNGMYWQGDNGQKWDVTACDLSVSYKLDMSNYTPPMWNTAWSSVGVGESAWGWMSSGAPAAAETNPNNQDIDDKLNLGAPDRYDEQSYNATDPDTIVDPPVGNPWLNYGIWFDRDGVDPYQALMWGMTDGVTYNTGGIYDVFVNFHAINPTEGTMFATVNGEQTGFYDSWKNAAPDYYPVGKSFSGDLTKVRVFANINGENIEVRDFSATGCLAAPTDMNQCKNEGWKIFNNPQFKNQGDCVSYVQSNENAVGNKSK